MARNITVTFDDGSTHVYQNAPDDITPDAVQARAEAEFGMSVTNLDGGRKAAEPGFFDRLGDMITGTKKESVLQGIQMEAPAGMTDDVSLDANRAARDRSVSPNSVMYTKANATDTANAAVERGAKVQALAKKAGYDTVPELVDAVKESESRQKFAEKSPNIAALASGSANMLRGTINAPGAAAGFVNRTFVDPVLGLAGVGPMPDLPTAPGTEALKGMASDYMSEVAKLPMDKAWDKGVFGEWLAANVSAQMPQMAGQIAAVVNPAIRAAVLPAMGAQAAGNSFADGDDPRVAVAKGVLEVLSEGASFGVADKIKDTLMKMPLSAQKSVFASVATKALAAGGAVTGQMLAGSIEETVAQLGNNALDIYASGKDKKLSDGVADSAVIGGVASAGMGAPNALTAMRDNSPAAQAARELSALLNGGTYSRSQLDGMGGDVVGRQVNPNLAGVPATPTAPRVQDQPTTPTVPNVGPTAGDPIAGMDDASILNRIPVEGQDGQTNTGGPAPTAAPTVQPAGDDRIAAIVGEALAELDVPNAGQPAQPTGQPAAPATISNPKGDIPSTQRMDAGSVQARLANELAALRQRNEQAAATAEAERVKAEADAAAKKASTGTNYRQQDATPVSPPGVAPNPQAVTALVEAGKGTAGKYADVGNTALYTEPVLYGIINHPNVGPELLDVARTELNRRRGKAPNVNVNTSASITGIPGNTGTRVAAPTGGSAGVAPTGAQGIGDQVSGEVQLGQPIQSAKPPQGGGTAANATRLAPAPAADSANVDAARRALYRAKKVTAVQSNAPLTNSQSLASVLANLFGRTFTVVERKQGPKNQMPNGFIMPGTNDIYVDKDSEDSPLFVTVHEIWHTLPEHIKAKAGAAIRALFDSNKEGEFGREFGVAKEEFGEEIPAYMVQAISKREDFWQNLRAKMGNSDFMQFATEVLRQFKRILGMADSATGKEFLAKYVGDEAKILKARDLLIDAYVEAAREQGVQPDAEVTGRDIQASEKPKAVENASAQPEDKDAFREDADKLTDQLAEEGASVRDVMQIDQLIDSKDIPVVTLQDFVGLSIFPTIADRTAAAAVYTGIDSSRVSIAVQLLGGPFFPLRRSNQKAGVVWANRGDGVVAQKAAKLKDGANYMLVVLGDADMHLSNSTMAAAFMSTMEAWERDSRISPEQVAALGKMVSEIGAKAVDAAAAKLVDARAQLAAAKTDAETKKAKKAVSQAQKAVTTNSYVENFPGFDDPGLMHSYMDGISFDARKRIMEIMASKAALDLGAPPMSKILDATREPSLAGHRWGDGVLLLEVDQTNPQVELGTEGTQPHPDYPIGIRGKIVGRLNTPLNWETLWQDWLRENADKDSPRRAFELAKPVVQVTQELVDSIGKLAPSNIDSHRQARLAADFAANNWKTSDDAVNNGGVSPQEFVDAIQKSDAKTTLTEYTIDQVKAGIKDKTMKIFQLGQDGQIFFMLKKEGGKVVLASVVNNEQGARGIGAPAVVLKAIEEGATDLDCFSVTSERFPYGFLPSLYAAFGFRQSGEPDAYNSEYFPGRKEADAIKYWQESTPGFDPKKGMPDLVYMTWSGKDEERTGISQRYLRSGFEGLYTGGTHPNAEGFTDEFGESDRKPAGRIPQTAANGSGAGGDQGAAAGALVASRARNVVRGLADLTPNEAKNLGLTEDDVAAARGSLSFSNKPQNLDQDITLTIPVEGGKTAKLTVNAKSYIDTLNKREDALRMVKECMI